jgi:hypothetical protein
MYEFTSQNSIGCNIQKKVQKMAIIQFEFILEIVAPLYVATPLNVALAAKCRTIDAKCRNRR